MMEILTVVKVCLVAIAGDTLLGWILAFTRHEFDIREAPRFLQTAVLPYAGGVLIVAGLAYLDPAYYPVFLFTAGIVTAKFGVEAIKDKIAGLINK